MTIAAVSDLDAERIAVAKACLDAAFAGSLGFPDIVGKMIEAGLEGYAVDYRLNRQTCYLPDGDCIDLDLPHSPGAVQILTSTVLSTDAMIHPAMIGETSIAASP